MYNSPKHLHRPLHKDLVMYGKSTYTRVWEQSLNSLQLAVVYQAMITTCS